MEQLDGITIGNPMGVRAWMPVRTGVINAVRNRAIALRIRAIWACC